MSHETVGLLIDDRRREREREASDERLAARARGLRVPARGEHDGRARVVLFGRLLAHRRQALT